MADNRPHEADVFRVRGVDVGIDYSWLIIFALVLWSLAAGYFPGEYPGYGKVAYALAGLAASLLFFASVLVHELSHAWMANHLGVRVQRITLFMFGGVSHLSGEPHGPGAELRIAAIGPLTSIALGIVFYALAWILTAVGLVPLGTAVLRYLSFVNLALAVFNLLPGFPLDGGRLLRAWLWHRSGNLQLATRRAADWGVSVAVGIMGLGALQIFSGALLSGLWLIFVGLFLRGAARASYYGMTMDRALSGTRVRDMMVRTPVMISPETMISVAVDDYFLRYGYGGFPVGTTAGVEGIVSLPMVKHCSREERATRRIRDIMRPLDDGLSIAPDATVKEALQQMAARNASRLIVSEHGHAQGLITRSGIMRLIEMKTELAASD